MSPDPRPPPNGASGHSPHVNGLPKLGSYANPYGQQPAQSSYAPSTGYAGSPQFSFNTPQAYQYQQSPSWQSQSHSPAQTPGSSTLKHASPPAQGSREMMPPPPRPSKDEREEKIGVEDFGDSLFMSGINLKDEENYIHAVYNNRHGQTDSFSTNQNTSFDTSDATPNNSFNVLTQGTSLDSQDPNVTFAGTLGRPRSPQNVELEQRRKREAAARARAERYQHHLNHQFLECNSVRKRMDRLALKQGVTLNTLGLYVRTPETNVMVNAAGNQGIVAATEGTADVKREDRLAESLVNQGAPFEQVVSLISLAAGDRVRGLLDEAFTLARARRYGDHGRVVPPEFTDIADGEGTLADETVTPENITGTQWDKLSEPRPQTIPTSSYQSKLQAHLRDLAQRDFEREQARIRKRKARRSAAANEPAEEPTVPTDTTPATTTAPAPVKMTKKEQNRQAKEKSSHTEAENQQRTNQTAAMMTGLGKKAKKYDWMTGGASAMPTNRYFKPAAAPAATVDKADEAKTDGDAAKKEGEKARVPEWGDWREGESAGIDIRDWVLVLERDGRDKMALERACLRMGG